eukprot:TRINITY_DN713_c0_g1_i1.p1 TRINITY_DN713_c0_g1~~TRINITY_DN713_c0_g1_i1.p1  ORF type:complete len:325 (+),score=97.26 TRINITY_DN713_c0_g1_i1:140-1114(+)
MSDISRSRDDSASKSKRPALTAFKQQQLRAWQPILTPLPVIITFLVIGIIFIPIGVVLLVASNSVVEYTQRYDDICSNARNGTNSTACSVSINVTQTMQRPVFLYYRLDNFYQNHRRYVRSRDDAQLRGDPIASVGDLVDCDPYISANGSQDINNAYFPCGLIAASFFNDTIALSVQNSGADTPINLRKNGIAWPSDVTKKFGNTPPNQKGIRGPVNNTDEDFIVWMRTAGLPNFKKLYRIIDQDLNPGNYTFAINDNFPVASFSGRKYVVISTVSWIGGKNPFLGWAFIAVGIVCFVQGVAFAIKHKISPRKLGDTKYLDWNK